MSPETRGLLSWSGEEGLAPNVALSYVTSLIASQKPTHSWKRVGPIRQLDSLTVHSFNQGVDQNRRGISTLYLEVIVIKMK